jgi:hypothetical protein
MENKMDEYCVWKNVSLPNAPRLQGYTKINLDDSLKKFYTFNGKTIPYKFPPMMFDVDAFDNLKGNDILWGGRPYMMFSKRLITLLKRNGVNNIQYFPVKIQSAATRELDVTYSIANIVGRFNCLDWKKSKVVNSPVAPTHILSIEKLKVDISKIPDSKEIFRMGEAPAVILCSKNIKKSVEENKIMGVSFVDVDEYSTNYKLREI